MDLKKLKLEKFKNIRIENVPDRYDLGIATVEKNVEVIIYFVQQMDDMRDFISLVDAADLPKENRVILVFEKGRRDDINSDAIIGPFRHDKHDIQESRR